MPVAPRIEIEGLNKLARELRALGDDAPKVLKEANRDAAKLVASEAAELAPVRSGRLRRSIRATGAQRGAAVRAGGARVPYAGIVHFGFPRRGIPARPFLYEAAERRRPDVIRAVSVAINRLIDRF